jgi:Glycosyltransferase (GlcNAc)
MMVMAQFSSRSLPIAVRTKVPPENVSLSVIFFASVDLTLCFFPHSYHYCFLAHQPDGERCGKTLKALFENAANPDKIVVGLVEQNAPEDKFCLEAYCEAFGKQERNEKEKSAAAAACCGCYNYLDLSCFNRDVRTPKQEVKHHASHI